MNMPWIDQYETKSWDLHEIPLNSEDWKSFNKALRVLTEDELIVCDAESPMAADLWRKKESVKGILFRDMELLFGMNLEPTWGCQKVGVLTSEWMGHPPGSQVMEITKGVTEDPPYFTIAVTDPIKI